MEAADEVWLSAADEVEAFDGGADSGWDVECVAEGDNFEWDSGACQFSEFFRELVDAFEKEGRERCGDLEGDVPGPCGAECGFDEPECLEDR
jgi:hypothetical protein